MENSGKNIIIREIKSIIGSGLLHGVCYLMHDKSGQHLARVIAVLGPCWQKSLCIIVST